MKTRALVIAGDVWHPAEIVRDGLSPLAESGFTFEFLEADIKHLPGVLPEFSMVVLAKANMISATDQRPWLTVDLARALRDHLRRGNGMVVIHAGTSRYEQSPEMLEMLGGVFASHPDQCSVTLEPKAGHPLAGGLENFTVRDEHYFMAMNSRQTVDVFLHSRSEHGMQPAGWTRTFDGGGRVCVLTPGHNLKVWLHPEFQKLLLNVFRWTAKLD